MLFECPRISHSADTLLKLLFSESCALEQVHVVLAYITGDVGV